MSMRFETGAAFVPVTSFFDRVRHGHEIAGVDEVEVGRLIRARPRLHRLPLATSTVRPSSSCGGPS